MGLGKGWNFMKIGTKSGIAGLEIIGQSCASIFLHQFLCDTAYVRMVSLGQARPNSGGVSQVSGLGLDRGSVLTTAERSTRSIAGCIRPSHLAVSDSDLSQGSSTPPVVVLPLSSGGSSIAHARFVLRSCPPRSRRGSSGALRENLPQLCKADGSAAVRIPLVKQRTARRRRDVEALHQIILLLERCDELAS